MKVLRTLKLYNKGVEESILFGEVDSDEELHETYKLRYSVYSDRGYIDPTRFPDGMEYDDYDTCKKCRYFVAVLNTKIIGYIRLIIDDPLPTEKIFTFSEPEKLKGIDRNKRCEFGRFVIIPPSKSNGGYLPRGLVRLFLYDVIAGICIKENLLGGYSFIKSSLEKKMKKMKMPIGEIKTYEQHYPESGVLFNYFSQSNDPVIPIFFVTKDFIDYTHRHIRNSSMFEFNGDSYVLKHNLYNFFLKKLKII